LILDGLGILPDVREKLVKELDVIINCAASLSFHDPLKDAI